MEKKDRPVEEMFGPSFKLTESDPNLKLGDINADQPMNGSDRLTTKSSDCDQSQLAAGAVPLTTDVVDPGMEAAQSATSANSDPSKPTAADRKRSHKNQTRPRPRSWTQLMGMLLLIVLVLVMALYMIPAFKAMGWSMAFSNLRTSFTGSDPRRTARMAERILSLKDKEHRPLVTALTAEAYWSCGDDVKATNLLNEEIGACEKEHRALSELELYSVLLSEQLRSGNTKSASETTQRSCDFASNLYEKSEGGLDKSIMLDAEAHRTLDMSPLYQNCGMVHWLLCSPSASMLKNCALFDRYGDFTDLKSFSGYVMKRASKLRFSDDDYSRLAAYSAIASFEEGDFSDAHAMTNLAVSKLQPHTIGSLEADQIRCFSRLAAECLAHNDPKSAEALLLKVSSPGSFSLATRNTAATSKLLEQTVGSSLSDVFMEAPYGCEQMASQLAWKRQDRALDNMFQALLSAFKQRGNAAKKEWIAIDMSYVQYLTAMNRRADGSKYRQLALNEVEHLPKSDSDAYYDMERLLKNLVVSSIQQSDPPQTLQGAKLMREAAPLDQFTPDMIVALVPAYKGNVAESLAAVLKVPVSKEMEQDQIALHATLGKLYFLTNHRSKAAEEFERAIVEAEHWQFADADTLAYLKLNLATVYNKADRKGAAVELVRNVSSFRRRLSFKANSYFTEQVKAFPELVSTIPSCIYPCDASAQPPENAAVAELPAVVTDSRY